MKKTYFLLLVAMLGFASAKAQQLLDNGWPLQFKSGTVYRWVSNNWNEYLKFTPTYNNGKLDKITVFINGGGNWTEAMKFAVNYDNEGRIATRTASNYVSGNWLVNTVDSFFYGNGNKPSSVITYQMQGATLKRYNRDTYIYGGNGLLKEIFHQDVDPDGSWSNDDYMYYYYDAQNRLSSIIRKDWNGATYVGKRNSAFTYSAGALEIIEQDTASGAWNNSMKYVFDSAVIETPTSINQLQGNGVKISAYPNPVKNALTVNLPLCAVSSQLTVTDVAGKIFVRRNVPANSQNLHLNMEALPAGVYILQYSNSQHTAISRIVKQ